MVTCGILGLLSNNSMVINQTIARVAVVNLMSTNCLILERLLAICVRVKHITSTSVAEPYETRKG